MRAFVAIVIVIVGVLCVLAGVLYLTQPAHALPTFLPGYVVHGTGKRTKHGVVAVAVGGGLILIALVIALTGRRRRNVWR